MRITPHGDSERVRITILVKPHKTVKGLESLQADVIHARRSEGVRITTPAEYE